MGSTVITRTVIETDEGDEGYLKNKEPLLGQGDNEKSMTAKLALPKRGVHKLGTIRNRKSFIGLEQEISPKNV